MIKKCTLVLLVFSSIIFCFYGCCTDVERQTNAESHASQDEYGFYFKKGNTALLESMNEFHKIIVDNGIYDDMIDRWVKTPNPPPMPEFKAGTKGTLTFASTCLVPPFAYYGQDGEMAGFEIEYARRLAEYKDMDIVIDAYSFSGYLAAVQQGRADFGASLVLITEERSKIIDFAEPYFVGDVTLAAMSEKNTQKSTFIDAVVESFMGTLIVENRWKMFIEGLGITIFISMCAMALGTILGFIVCYFSMCRFKSLNKFASVYIVLFRGIPMLVLLMIIYYIIFSDINSMLAAIVAFSLNVAAYISEICRTSIAMVDRGQIECARSMGFSAIRAFSSITLPQAVRTGLPIYKSEFIALVQATSIVGFIAIIDLARVGDIIQSRTYGAFFPLIFVSLIYLVLVHIFIFIFDKIYQLSDKRFQRDRECSK